MTKVVMLIVGAVCLFTAGCAVTTAEMLARPGGQYGPTAGSDFGLIRYQAGGSQSDIQQRQDDANRQMYEACGGHYRILRQGTRNQISMGPGGGRFGRMPTASSTNYVYIKFACTRRGR
ncbi:MAG: hypothetical protein ACRETC_01350 [Gammaproteobacteria bacterium]